MTQARIAQNQARFRKANEQMEDAAFRQGLLPDEKIPFLCECPDENCREVIRMSFNEYEEVRADARTFISAPNHETTVRGVLDEIVVEREGYNIVRKRSHAGDVAAAFDERGDDERAAS